MLQPHVPFFALELGATPRGLCVLASVTAAMTAVALLGRAAVPLDASALDAIQHHAARGAPEQRRLATGRRLSACLSVHLSFCLSVCRAV